MAKIDKLLKHAKTNLDDGEEILAAIEGNYRSNVWAAMSSGPGMLFATPFRVAFYRKQVGGYHIESFMYEEISSIERSKAMLGHQVVFFASGNRHEMKLVRDGSAMDQFIEVVKSHLHGQQQVLPSQAANGPSFAEPQAPSARASDESSRVSDDIMGQIRQLGELHQAGVLSDDEFSSKKAELLARL